MQDLVIKLGTQLSGSRGALPGTYDALIAAACRRCGALRWDTLVGPSGGKSLNFGGECSSEAKPQAAFQGDST